MIKFKAIFIAILLAFACSCTLVVDVDDDDEAGSLQIEAKGDGPNGAVPIGTALYLTVTAADKDGISSMTITIPELNVATEIMNSEQQHYNWTIDQTFDVPETTTTGLYEITIRLKDKNGNEYSQKRSFRIVAHS